MQTDSIKVDFIIKNAKKTYNKDGLSISGSLYDANKSWLYNGVEFDDLKVEHLDDELFIDKEKTVYEIQQ